MNKAIFRLIVTLTSENRNRLFVVLLVVARSHEVSNFTRANLKSTSTNNTMSELSDSESAHTPSQSDEPSGTDEQKQVSESVPDVVEIQQATQEVQLEVTQPVEYGMEEIKVVDANGIVIAQVIRMLACSDSSLFLCSIRVLVFISISRLEPSSLDQIENYDLSESRPQSLIARLGQYSIVNSALTTYTTLKNSNGLLGAGLTSAENATAVALV
jgi:cytoskeletal protein RodZ